MTDPTRLLPRALGADADAWLRSAVARLGSEPALPELFPQLPRRLSRDPLVAGDGPTGTLRSGDCTLRSGDCTVDAGAWRCCDAGALRLLQVARPGDDVLMDLFWHGDMEERAMLLRCLSCLPVTRATIDLLGEAQRTNTVPQFEAAVCDSNLLARTLAAGRDDFGIPEFNRMILKMAFIDLPLARVLDWQRHANPALSRMVQGLATEREAAGRGVWRDTNRVIARAPTDGSLARLCGGLEHGDDGTRLAAAEGMSCLDDDALSRLRPLATERLDREPRPQIRDALQRAIERQPGD